MTGADAPAQLATTVESDGYVVLERAIARDLENASTRYQEIRAKQMTAEVAQEMEKERKSEKFTLIDPAILPEKPVSPNRPAIIFLSLVLAMGAGIGSAAVRESLDNAIRGVKSLTSTVHTAPLAVIPYVTNTAEADQQRQHRMVILAMIAGAILLLFALVHFFIGPLDVMWFRAMRKFDSLLIQ